MAVNKVQINGVTQLDLTQDSVSPETLLSGKTAHNKAGNRITGTLTQPEITVSGSTMTIK
nr:MAG TPA: tail protein [Caudoviricetes sp.]